MDTPGDQVARAWHASSPGAVSLLTPGAVLCRPWRGGASRERVEAEVVSAPAALALIRPRIKAGAAYGEAVVADLRRALDGLNERPGHLQRCMRALSMTLPPALLQQRLRALRRRLARVVGGAWMG